MGQSEEPSLDARGTRLSVELGGFLLIQFQGLEDRFKVSFVGMEAEEFLIVRTPASHFLKEHLISGTQVTVRFVHLGNAYGFRSSILSHVSNPVPLLFLSYPQKIETLNLRKAKRIECFIPASARIRDRGFAGLITDISTDGCRFSFKLPKGNQAVDIEVDDELTLSFPLLGMEGEKVFHGLIMSLSRDLERISLGVRFDTIAPEVASNIEATLRRVSDFQGTE
jgi:hypothetical protein